MVRLEVSESGTLRVTREFQFQTSRPHVVRLEVLVLVLVVNYIFYFNSSVVRLEEEP